MAGLFVKFAHPVQQRAGRSGIEPRFAVMLRQPYAETNLRALRSIVFREEERLALCHAEFALFTLRGGPSAPEQPPAGADAQEHALRHKSGPQRWIVQHIRRAETLREAFPLRIQPSGRITQARPGEAAAFRVRKLFRCRTFHAAAALAQNGEHGGSCIPAQREPEREALVPRKGRAGLRSVLPQARLVIHIKRRSQLLRGLTERPYRQKETAVHRLSRRLFS